MIFTSSFRPAGTKTGRLASSMFLGVYGSNGQNISDDMRRLFVPRPGMSFIQNDLEGAEAVAVALLVSEGNFRELVRRKVKIHNFVCVKIFPEKFAEFFTRQEIDNLTPAAFHEHPNYKALVKHCKSLKVEYDLAKRTVHGCLTADHEVLTRAGWRPIHEVVDAAKDEIMVYDAATDSCTFEYPLRYIKNGAYKGELHTVTNAYGTVDITMTSDHKVPYITNGKLKYTTPFHIPKGAGLPYAKQQRLEFDETELTWFARLHCAFNADGHAGKSGRITFHFQKERKTVRLMWLLKKLNVEPRRKTLNSDLTMTIELPDDISQKLMAYGKPLRWDILTLPLRAAAAYVDECKYWDGYIASNQECFVTTDAQQAEIVHTLARLVGIGSTWNTQERDETRQDIHRVGFNRRTQASYTSCTHSYQTCAHMPVYCFEVSTGMFLVRRKRAIMITGNSNYSMGWVTFQETVLKETAGRVALPAAECKRLLNAYFTLFPEVKVFQASADKAAQDFLEINNLFGWGVRLIQRYTTAAGRTAISWAPQSTVGVATIVAATRCQVHIELQARRWNLLNIVHDSILLEAPTDEAAQAADVLADCMTFTFTSPIDGWQCTIGVEKSIGKNWGKYDEKENPEGLKVI